MASVPPETISCPLAVSTSANTRACLTTFLEKSYPTNGRKAG